MKKFFVLAFVCLASLANASTTVTGTLQNLGTGTVSSGSYVRVWLRGCSGNQPRISGTALIAPSSGGVFYWDFTPNASGVISGTLYSTRDSAGTGSGDIECGGSLTAVWYGVQIFTTGKGGPEIPVHAKSGVTLDLTNVTPITTVPVVTAPTGDGSYLQLTGGNSPVTGNVDFKGINGIRFCDLFSGALSSDKLVACYANFTTGLGVAPPGMESGASYPSADAKMLLDLRGGVAEWDTYATTDYVQPYRWYVMLDPASNTSQLQFGVSSEVSTKSTNSKTWNGSPIAMYASLNHFATGAMGSGYAAAFEFLNSGPATVTEGNGVNANCRNGGVDAGHPEQTATNNGTVTNCRTFHSNVFNSSTNPITNSVHFYVGATTNTGGGGIINDIGVQVTDRTTAINNWAIKTGLGKVQFGDVLQSDSYSAFGSTNDKTAAFLIVAPANVMTGTTQWAAKVFPTFSSAATAFGVAVYGRADTQATSFTQTRNAAFFAESPVKGAGSTIGTAYGYYCADIAAGTSNRCFYSEGAAKSEFNGGVIVGTGVGQGSGLKHQRFSATTATAASANGTQTTTFSWTSGFSDTSYTPTCTPGGTITGTPVWQGIVSYNTSGVTVQVMAATAAASSFGAVYCEAKHDN